MEISARAEELWERGGRDEGLRAMGYQGTCMLKAFKVYGCWIITLECKAFAEKASKWKQQENQGTAEECSSEGEGAEQGQVHTRDLAKARKWKRLQDQDAIPAHIMEMMKKEKSRAGKTAIINELSDKDGKGNLQIAMQYDMISCYLAKMLPSKNVSNPCFPCTKITKACEKQTCVKLKKHVVSLSPSTNISVNTIKAQLFFFIMQLPFPSQAYFMK